MNLAMTGFERALVAMGFCLTAFSFCWVVYHTALWLVARRMKRERRDYHG